MKQCRHIFKRDFRTYFVSPIAYIVISIFLLVTGWFFFSAFFVYNQASMRSFFVLLPYVMSFIVPAVTMKLFSEELNVGTYETLLTMPVTFSDVIAGKFLAALAFIVAMLAPTISYPLFISFTGELDWGAVTGGYAGALLLGAAFSAAGIFASSLTRNQIIAFITGVAICFFLTLIDKMLIFAPASIVVVLENLGADYHFQNIAKGVIDSRDVIYFLSIVFIGLYGTNLAMKSKY